MNKFQESYRAKCISHEELVGKMKPGNSVFFGIWFGQPQGVLRALDRYGRHIDPLYLSVSHATLSGEALVRPNIQVQSSFLGPWERSAQREHQSLSYIPLQFTDAKRLIREGPPTDFLITRVTPMDDRGYFNFSLTSSWEYNAALWLSEHSPQTRIVFEVNPRMPRVHGLERFGNHEIHISHVDYVVEDDTPLLDFPTPEPTPTERQLASHVARLVDDRATLQLGFGSLPMVIGKLLSERRDLGIHSEMFCQAHVDLIEAGSVTNAHKQLFDGVSVATFVLGEESIRRWVTDNPAVALLPVEEVNSVPILSQIQNMTSINSILTIDLCGQACAHCIGPETYSGLGGAFEFAYGAQLSPGGKSIICLPSTKTLKDGREVSNIIFQHPLGTRITLPEHCVDWVVTEFGGARLKFLSIENRAKALINLAHPKYREDLANACHAQGLNVSGLSKRRPPLPAFFCHPE